MATDPLAEAELLILDLDGTVRSCTVAGQPCPNKPGEQGLHPLATLAIRRALAAGQQVAFATNQGGIGLGYMDLDTHKQIIDELRMMLTEATGWDCSGIKCYTCPHSPDEGCSCRKPEPGMLLRAAHD